MFRFRIWKRIEIGGVSREEYAKALVDEGVSVSAKARGDVLKKISLPGEKMRVALVKVTNTQLGLGTGYVPCGKVYARALELGLQKCPAEVGLALRMEVRRQSEVLLLGMEPMLIPAYLGTHRLEVMDEFLILSIQTDKDVGRALYAPDARPAAVWDPSVPHAWIFAKEIHPII